MSQYISYKVNQDVLQWAIKESQKDVAEIKDKYPQDQRLDRRKH